MSLIHAVVLAIVKTVFKSNSIYNQQNHGSKVKIKLFLSIWVLVLMSKFAMSIFVSIA